MWDQSSKRVLFAFDLSYSCVILVFSQAAKVTFGSQPHLSSAAAAAKAGPRQAAFLLWTHDTTLLKLPSAAFTSGFLGQAELSSDDRRSYIILFPVAVLGITEKDQEAPRRSFTT